MFVAAAVRRSPLVAYFGLAFLFTWALLPFTHISVVVSLIALLGPAVSAFITAALTSRAALRELRARILLWRVPARWYVLALALPVAVSALRSAIEYTAGAGGPIQLQPISTLGLIVFVLVAGEEIGWRGFALPQLLARFRPWSASAILGALWALWHLPLFFMPGMPQHGMQFVPYIGYLIALSVILTWLAQRTMSSVLIATLFHGAVNTFGIVNIEANTTLRGWGNTLAYGVAALAIGVVAWKRRPVREVTSNEGWTASTERSS